MSAGLGVKAQVLSVVYFSSLTSLLSRQMSDNTKLFVYMKWNETLDK